MIASFTVLLVTVGSTLIVSEDAGFTVRRGVRQLFLDDVGIAEMVHVKRVLHEPQRHPANPLLVPDKPWESRCQVYGTAYFDESEEMFKLWYLTTLPERGSNPLVLNGHKRPPHTTLAAYAYSKDGIHWIKPHLNLLAVDGDSNNNLLGIGWNNCEGVSVLHEPHDPDPQRRWKMVYWDHGSGGFVIRENGRPYSQPGEKDGWYAAFSPDGIHWTPYNGNPVLKKYCDTNQNVLYDPGMKKYVGFSRFHFGRKLARSESEDFLHWGEPQVVIECDEADGRGTQIYGAGVDLYESTYIAMIWLYRERGDGTIDTQLAASRDGKHWTRVADRKPWLSLGPEGTWEGGMVRSVERIIRRENTLYIYYCGVPSPHGGNKGYERWQERIKEDPSLKELKTSIGLVTLRRDGFVSLQSGQKEGYILTQPFELPEGKLHVNFDGGRVQVALCDERGKPFKGFERSNPVYGDQLDSQVSWEQAVPESLRSQRVRLRLYTKDTDLYSYWWE
jgi:hypothetical protein